jgi:D-alanine-D-alanine ligase-like ATP-grasp enzyme
LTGLLADPAALAHETATALDAGVSPEQLIVVEFSAEPLACGIWRKLSVYRVGDRLFADSCVHERSWMAKIGPEGIAPDDVYADELRLMRENPYGQAMLRVFELAGVEYGRVDFGLVSGRPSVYEINTNPQVEFLPDTPSPYRNETRRLFRDHYLSALAALA